ncbi:MAG: hypothetical protein U1C57_01815 [Candidatus Doudnabacteria bacterium]|nr:hypothetical protein [Candidatus Doudnabacteria bacterium]
MIVTGRKVGAGQGFYSALAHNEELFARVVEFVRNGGNVTANAEATVSSRPVLAHEVEHLISGMFIPADKQLGLVRERNVERRWGFTEEDFTKLGPAPVWPSGKISAVILEVSLDTIEKTLEEAWLFAHSAQVDNWRWEEVKSDPGHLRLFPGIEHKRGLVWRVVDLAANWDKKDGIRPKDVRNTEKSPHSAVLWAASYFPKWIQAMDGTIVPYVWIPGYELSVSGYKPWSSVPDLRFSRGYRRIRLDAHDYGPRNGSYAVPEFRE